MLRESTSSSLTAFILAGGLGTRLRSVVADRPKVMAEVAGRPWLAFLLDELMAEGVRHVVLGTGYLGEQIEAAFGSRYGSLSLAYSRESEPLGTAGALRLALPQMGDSSTVLVLNGDSFCDVDVTRFGGWHASRGAAASILLASVADASRFGAVETTQDGVVTAFREKVGSQGIAPEHPSWINAGMYLLDAALIESLPAGVPMSLERDVFPALLGRGLHGYRGGGRFIDMGLPESFAKAQTFFPVEPRGAVLLDRDGTIIVERHYLADPEGVELLPGAAEGIRRMRELGLAVAVVSNQSGLGRGYLDEATLHRIHERMASLLAEEGAALDAVFYCPHTPSEQCTCRKPATGLAEQAARALGFSLSRSFVVGDKACDIDLGHRLGLPSLLVRTGYGDRELAAGVTPSLVVADLACAAAAVGALLAHEGPQPVPSDRRSSSAD